MTGDGRTQMKISMRGRYALRLMLDLAENDAGEPVSLKDIAGRQEISEKYLEQVVSLLNKAGLVRSIRGSQGGYRLVKKPYDYKVGEILRMTEGCLQKDEEAEDDISRMLWKRMDEALDGVIDTVTLEDMMLWKEENAYNYSI